VKRTRFDGWLAGICASRVFNGLVFMSYAAAIPVLQREWGMSAAEAGLIASGFQIGYAVSLVVCSSIADRIRRTAVPAAGRHKEQRFTREVLGNRPAMLLIWGYTCHNWELLGMWSWTPAFLASRGPARRAVALIAA